MTSVGLNPDTWQSEFAINMALLTPKRFGKNILLVRDMLDNSRSYWDQLNKKNLNEWWIGVTNQQAEMINST